MAANKVIFEITMHRTDADHVIRLAALYGIEVQDFLAIAAMRYVQLVESGVDAPGRCRRRINRKPPEGD
jgi:hypothetical protein